MTILFRKKKEEGGRSIVERRTTLDTASGGMSIKKTGGRGVSTGAKQAQGGGGEAKNGESGNSEVCAKR